MERECIICWAPPTVRFGCGHSFLCGGEDCLGAWLAEHKPCVPALTPRAQENSAVVAFMLFCHGARGFVVWSAWRCVLVPWRVWIPPLAQLDPSSQVRDVEASPLQNLPE